MDKTPNADTKNFNFHVGFKLPTFAEASPGDEFVILTNDEYSVYIVPLAEFNKYASEMEGTEDGKALYSRVLSKGAIDNNGFLFVSELFKTMVEDNNRGCKGMEHNKRIVFQNAGDGCIKMYYSEEAFKAYIKSLVAEMIGPQKKIGEKPKA